MTIVNLWSEPLSPCHIHSSGL